MAADTTENRLLDAGGRGTFSDRVAVLFATQVFATALGIFNGLLLARLLGPSGKGQYYLVALIPGTIMVLVQLGLPQALGFYAARDQTRSLVGKAVVLAGILSGVALLVVVVAMPVIRGTLLRDIETWPIIIGLLVVPALVNATFMTGIVLGRQAVRWNLGANVVAALTATVLLVVVVGIMGLGVTGAVIVFFTATMIQSLGFLAGALRVTAHPTQQPAVTYRQLVRYGLPLFPGALTLYFGYRLDVYLIAWLMIDSSTQLGYYSMAVTIAEMAFFVPSAVSTLFFPHVAGSEREQSDAQVSVTSRATLLITAATGVGLVPVSIVLFALVLPAFGASMVPLLILLPGIVALSVNKVVTGYLQGIGLTGLTSAISVGAFAVNLIANLALIPAYGIAGAAMASLISYTASSIACTVVAARLARVPMLAFWVPRGDDVRFVWRTALGMIRRLLRRRAAEI